MNCGVPVAVLLAVTVSLVVSDPVHHRTEGRYQCAGYCRGGNKFRYVPGTTYVYDYTASTLTSIRGATKEKSQLHLSATANFHILSECDFVLQLENVQLADSELKTGDIRSVTRSAQFAALLQKNSLHFSFQDGTVDELCPGDDPAWVLNIKRGILSAFQNTMHDLSSARERHYESDIAGICETRYDVILEEDELNKPRLVVGKMKNLLACSHRVDHFLSVQSTPYMPSSAQSLPLIKSQQRGSQVIGDGILQKAANNEIHTFRPFSKHDGGAVTMVNQILNYKTSHNGEIPQRVGTASKRRTTLLYEHADTTNYITDQEYTVIELLKELVRKTHLGVESDVPSMFSRLVVALTSMNYTELEKVFSHATDEQMRKFLLDAMPLIRTADGVEMMIQLFKSGEITVAQIDSWLTSIAFQRKPTLDMMSSVLPLLDGSPSANALLGISALVHNYCQQNENCIEMDEVKEIMRKFEGLLGSDCQSTDHVKQQLIILALKAIGNAGVFIDSSDTIRKCSQAVNSIEVRLAAISAYRRLPCTENTRLHFLDLYTNKHEDTELRIAAYLTIMQCPSSHTIQSIKDTLYSEEVNQVASFVWTHLTNLQETSSHWKQHIRALVSSDFLQNKFSTDARKFSRNYEGSFFSESLNAGAAAESNVVFTPQSYLPRSATLNLTLDLFGESVNILELGARAEGFENIVENLFGPEGYLPDNAMNKMLKNLKDKHELDNVENRISQIADQFNRKGKLAKEPSASVYTRVFGNELHCTQLHGLKELIDGISGATSFDLVKKIMQERDVDFTKSLVLIDGSYMIPTCIGFPLNLALNGSATVGFKLNGHANIKDMFSLNSVDIEGSVMPSAAVEFAGTMAVDATITKAGIRLVSTLHTNTYMSGKVKIQGGDLVDLQLNVPHNKTELLNVASQIFVLHHDKMVESKGIEDNMENYTLCSTDFMSSLIGMKPCMELTYINSSLHPSAPYFPLTGPFRFHLDITKTDTFNAYELIFKRQASKSETSVIFNFDTPGSKVDRKLSAQYVLDRTNSAAKASIVTPFIKVTASGKVENSDAINSLDATITLNNQELVMTRVGYKRIRTGHIGRYEPFFELSFRNRLIADITGKVNYVEGFKYNADLAIKGLSKEPITVSGNINMNEDKYNLMGNIMSKALTSTFHGSLHFTKNYLSTKATVQYKTGETQPHKLAFSAKFQDNSKGKLLREGVYITLQMSQFPHYDVDAFWEMQRSNHYFESTCKVALGNTVWQTQQLYRYHSTEDNFDLALLCTLTCPRLGVDYGVDVQYQVTNATISSHFKTTITPQYKLLALLNYLRKLEGEKHQHELDIELNSPWYKTGMHGTVTESTPSRYEIQVSGWWVTQTDVHGVNISGFYLDGSNKVKMDHQLDISLTGGLNGKLVASLTSSNNVKKHWIQLDAYNKTYLANVTYVKDLFHFMEGTVQLADSVYGGSLVLLNTSVEKGFAVDLKLRKRLSLATKITCDNEKHGLQFELFWDKDANPNKKISLMAEAVGNKKEIQLEIPGRYLKGEVVTVASGVTGFLEWEENHKISVQLEWNLDEGNADITAKLHTPFPRMRFLSLFGTYSLLQNEGVLVVETSWQEEKLYLTVNMKKINTVSNFWGWTMGAHLWSTVPAIANISFDLDFRSRTDEQLTIKTLAVLNYNTKESALEANWKSDKSSLFGDIQLHSHIQHLEFVKYTLKFIESSVETSGSLEMNWASQNKIFAEFFFKKVDGAAGTFRITTPFTGYKITAAEYNFTNFQDDNGITHLRMKADALFKEYLAMIDISGSKSNSSLGGILQLKTPFTEEVKIDVLHQIENGKLNEKLLVSLAEEDLLFLYLVGEVCSFSNVQLSAGLQMPNQNMNIRVETYLSPGSLEFNCRGEWNTKSISTVAVGRYENTDDILSIHLDMTADSSLLSQNVKLAFHHASSQGTFQTTLHLPGDIILTNVFIIHDSLNWKNKLDFKSPSKTGFIENKQSFVDGVRLEHEMIANLNGQQATGLVTFIKDPQSFVIREAKAVLNVPWTDPIIILYLFPNDEFHIRPSLVFQFRHTKEIRIEIDLEYQLLHSRLQMEITSAFYKPILVNASYSIAKQKLTGQILTQWDNKKIHIESNLNFEFDMMKTSGDFFVRHSDMDTDAANGSFDYNMTGPEITAHALGTYRNQKLGFGLSLLLGRNVYKGSITVQTPFQNWENLSFSCHINISKPVHLAVITLSRNHEDITVSGLIRSDIYSSKFNVAMTSHILGFHSTSVYGAYSAPNSSDHSIELAYDNNDKRIEILAKLQVDNDSFLNAIMAEGSLKTPFKGYETMLAHYSYNTKGNEKKLDLQLVKSSWKFVIESECSFGSGIVNGKVKVELPFEELKEMSFSLRYGYTPSTLERTVNIAVSRNLDVVEMAGALLINKDGSLMADAMLKSPVSGYKQVKFNVAVSASKEKKKSVTVTFSRDQEDYMISGTFTFNTEARLVIITPLKGYENIEARIGYIRHDEDHLNSTINERLYGYLDMATGKSELNIDLNLKEMNSIISANIISPLLMVPHIEIKGEYDLRMFPGSVSFIVNKDAIKVVSIQIILERNRFMGEIITPIEKYTDINLFASFRNEEEKKHMNFKMKLGEHSFQLLSTTVFGAFNSKILAEVVTTVPGIDRITLHGQYGLLHDEKTAELVITLDPSNTYELFISGTADSKIGQFKVQVYTPVSEFESVFLAAKYDLTKDCYMNILVEKNDIKNYFGGHVAFTDDGTLIRIETPFKHAEDISFHYTYHAGNNERSENLIVVRNGHLTILESSFKYENNVAVINLTTQLEAVYGFLITLDFNGMPVEGKEYALSISVLKNSQPLLKASSHILIDCSKEIYAKFELNTPLLPNNFEHLSFNLCFTPVFPPPKILMTVLKNEIPILDLRSDFGQKLSGFTYDLKFMSGHVQRLLSIDFSPGEKNVKFNIDSIADTPEQYIGDLRFNKATGTLSAIFTSPIVGFDKFSFQWKQGHDSIDTEIITPFKGYENLSLAAHFKVKHIRKSAMLFISKNDDTIGFSMSTDHADGSDELALYAVTPFTVLKKFDVQTQYIKSETKKIVRLNVTVSNQHFKIGGELLSKENILQAKLDISSSLQDLEQINSNFFYDITESLTFGGKLDIGDISTNISGTIDFDFLQGELLGSLNRHGQLKERRFMWSLENTHLMKTAKIAVNLGYELNFVIDAILNISNLKNVKAQVSFIKPVHIHQLYPYTSTYKLQWNIRNVMAFDGGLFIMLNNVPYCNLNLNVDLDNATEVKILNAHYLGFSYNYRIHLTYQLMNNNSIELLSKINLGGTELIISLNFMLNNTKFITRCGEFHFSLGYNLTTKRKILDIEYQISQNIYRLSSNLTFHKPYLPVVSITLKTPVRHYSFLHLSNQYIMNTTHKGFKILLQKEERNGEISLSMWKNRNNIGLKGNMSLPFKDLKTWYGIGNLDMTSGLEGNVNCSWDSTKHLALNFRYAPDSLKANINTPFTGLENINAEFLLNRKDIMEILISVNWGDKKIFLNGSGGLDNGNKPEFIIFFLSPWADPFTLSGKYENRVNPVVTILLQRGSELARLEGQIEYSITDLKFVMKFSSELNGHKMTIKTGYDFEYQTKKIYFEARFVSLSFIINGALNSEGMDGRLYVKTPFSFFQEIAADGILTIGQSATFKLRWNDKLYILNGEYEHTHGHLGCKFTLLSPYVRVENIKFDIKYDYESAYLKLEIPIEALYLDCSYHFQTYVYSVGATLKVPSVTLLKRLSFAATLDTANLTASAIGQWSASQVVNISASLLPSNQFIKVETPFEGFEKILILGSLKNESTHLAFAGKLEVGNDNSIHVHHIIGYGFMQHSITINMPVLDKMNFNVILQFDDPRNMSTKLTFGPTTTESTFSAEGMLDLKDMFGQFNVHHPFMEGNLVCKTLWDVKANLQIKTSTILKVKGSYTLSRNDIIVKWNTQTSHSQSFTALGGSYEYDHKSELKTKLFFNEDIITSYYKINSTSMTVNFKLNSPALLKIKDFSLDIEGSHSPNLHGSFSYKYNTQSVFVTVILSKTQETVTAQGIAHVQPLLGPVHHMVQIAYNVKDPQNFFQCKYEGNIIHKALMSYKNDDRVFKVTLDVNSEILGTHKILMLLEKNGQFVQLEIMNMFSVSLKAKQNEGHLIVRASGMEHEAFYQLTYENGFHGSLTLVSPLISNGKINVTAAAKCDIENIFADLKYVAGMKSYHVTFEINSTEERTSVKVEVISLLKTILSLNAYIVVNRYDIQAETLFEFFETVSSAMLRHRRALPLNTELNIMSPYFPKKVVKFVLNTENNSITLYGGHGDKSYGEYIMLEGTINHNDCMAYLNFIAPKLPLAQYINISGIFRPSAGGKYDLEFSTQFSSEILITEFSAKFHISSAGLDTAIKFVPPWEDMENYGAKILIPFSLSNNMKPCIALHLGKNNTYALHGKFVYLKDIQEIGFGAQYKLRKLGASLKTENAPIPGIQFEIDIPLGDNVGHYGVNVKNQKGKNLLGIASALNYTHIGVEWDSNLIELRYTLSDISIDAEERLDINTSLKCTLLLELTTPFSGYEQNGLKMSVNMSSSYNLIVISINYPGSSKPFGFELNYQLKAYNDVSLVSQLHIPFIPALEDVALMLSNKFEEKDGRFRSVLGGHWNKEELAITLEGNLKEEIVFKGTMTLKLIEQTFTLEANYGTSKRDTLGPFVMRVQLTSPLTVLKNAEVYVEINVMRSVVASITYNSKELLGFHIYSDEVLHFGAEIRNQWRSAYFVCSYDTSKDIIIQAELAWDMNQLSRSQFVVVFAMTYGPDDRQEMSVILKLPSRVLKFNFTQQLSPVHTEYAGSLSWTKHNIIGFKTLLHINASSDVVALLTMGRIDLPHRSFELGSYASARLDHDTVIYADIRTEFLWDALEDRNKKIGIALRHYSSILEIVLQHVAMRNDLVVRIEKHGRLSYNHLPFAVKIEVEYSTLPENLITMEAHVQYLTNTAVGLNMGFSLHHIATSIDFKIGAEIAQTLKENIGRMSAEYLNSYTGQKHIIEFMGKMSLLHPEMKISVRTAENRLEVHGLLQTGNSGHYAALVDFIMNQKEPLHMRANIFLAEPRAELEARYGDHCSYKMYAGVPHCREVTFGVKHVLYGVEHQDAMIMLRLNSSQQLWSRIRWQPRALTELKTSILQEYSDVSHVVQSIGSGFSEAWLKDFAYKSNIVYPVLVDMFDQIVSTSMIEAGEIYMDFLDMGEELKRMYRRNDFYLQDIQPYVSKLTSYFTEKASGICKLLLDGTESMYLAVTNFVVMVVNTFEIDLSHVFSILDDIKVVAGKTVMFVVNCIDEIKRLHTSSKEYLKTKIEATRLQILHVEENMKHLLTYVENYLADLLASYSQLLEPYLTSIENTLELLSRRVIDFEDKISVYILDMVDTVLGAEEVQELVMVYNRYSSWLEELHLQDYIDQVAELFEGIGELIMQDIQRVFGSYLEYVKYITDAMNNVYSNINAMPLIAYSKHAMNIAHEKAKWVWQHYRLNENIKAQVHSWIENLDKILLRLLNAIDMDARSPTKSLTPSITLHPDIGLIEYSQKLPIEWNCFNELPKFEQLQLYEQLKDHANEVASLEKYRYYLMNTFYDITNNISLTSAIPPFSAYGMVIGNHHYITYDKKFYNFTGAGECSYLLANDFLHNRFSAFVTYKIENMEAVKKSLSVLVEGHHIEINSNRRVEVDGLCVDLPVAVDSQTWIKRTGERILVHSELGIEVECNFLYDICIIELSGWYFGKTGGMLGTFDYEPSNDLTFPNGTAAHTIEAFANSWHVGSARCHSVNHATLPINLPTSEESQTLDSNQCTAYFEDQLSPLRRCFSRVETGPFYQMCLSELAKNTGVCTSVAAYVSQCRRAGVDIWIPQKCVHCPTLNGSTMNTSQLEVYDGVEAMLADVVFVVEQSSCIKKINLAELVSKLDTAMNLQGLNTRFSVVGFNGNKFSEPYTHTSGGEIWASLKGTEKVLRSLQTATSKSSSSGNQRTFSAMQYVSRLPFRATASKTIVLLQCTLCQETEDEYSHMISMLLENDITLHILQPHALKLHSGQGKASKVYGVDLNGAFSGRNLKNLMPSFPLLRQVVLPKDLCVPLAFETNGTFFNMDHLLHKGKGAHRLHIKKFIDVWARRVTLTATPSQCQTCRCIANQDGMGQIMCSKCVSPSIEHFLKNWGNLSIGNQRTKVRVADYVEYPA